MTREEVTKLIEQLVEFRKEHEVYFDDCDNRAFDETILILADCADMDE